MQIATTVATARTPRTIRRTRGSWPLRCAISVRTPAAVVVRSSMIAISTMHRPLVVAAPTSLICSASRTGWPRPGPLMRVAMVAMDRAAIVVWLRPTRIVRRAIGSCTVRSS